VKGAPAKGVGGLTLLTIRFADIAARSTTRTLRMLGGGLLMVLSVHVS
jgi:hypothetical protein